MITCLIFDFYNLGGKELCFEIPNSFEVKCYYCIEDLILLEETKNFYSYQLKTEYFSCVTKLILHFHDVLTHFMN